MSTQPSPELVSLISAGPFGAAVAHHLSNLRKDVSETPWAEGPIQPAMARVTILAAWRPLPLLCEQLDELSFQWQRPFVPVMTESAVLRIGPVVVPGRGPCWHCWEQRSRQHSKWPAAEQDLREYYAANPQAGPRGYLEPFAVIAAARAAQIIEELDSSQEVPGYIWQIDMMTREIITSVVAGVHDCPRCGLHRSLPELGYEKMERELAYLWESGMRAGRGK
jgi:bacteriocin biosynthesis cyclodehydratase domain-containing protein